MVCSILWFVMYCKVMWNVSHYIFSSSPTHLNGQFYFPFSKITSSLLNALPKLLLLFLFKKKRNLAKTNTGHHINIFQECCLSHTRYNSNLEHQEIRSIKFSFRHLTFFTSHHSPWYLFISGKCGAWVDPTER